MKMVVDQAACLGQPQRTSAGLPRLCDLYYACTCTVTTPSHKHQHQQKGGILLPWSPKRISVSPARRVDLDKSRHTHQVCQGLFFIFSPSQYRSSVSRSLVPPPVHRLLFSLSSIKLLRRQVSFMAAISHGTITSPPLFVSRIDALFQLNPPPFVRPFPFAVPVLFRPGKEPVRSVPADPGLCYIPVAPAHPRSSFFSTVNSFLTLHSPQPHT